MDASTIIEMLESNTDMRFCEKTDGVVTMLRDGEVIHEDIIARMCRNLPDGLYKLGVATYDGSCQIGNPNEDCSGYSPTKCGVLYMHSFLDCFIKIRDLGIND